MHSISLGIFHFIVNYLMKPKGRHTWHYRRSVPKDLRQHYSQPTILKSLKTKDEKTAAVICASMDRQYEMEFSRLRRGLPKRPAPAKHQLGTDKLMQFGIDLTVTDEGTVQHADRIEPFETHIMNLLHDAVGAERIRMCADRLDRRACTDPWSRCAGCPVTRTAWPQVSRRHLPMPW